MEARWSHGRSHIAAREVTLVPRRLGIEIGQLSVDLIGTPLTSFSKIVAAGDTPEIFNGFCGAESGYVPVSAVSPAILTTQIEVQKKAKSSERPPILPPPVAANGGR